MKNYFSTSVLIDGYLYGFNDTKLACVDFNTGKPKWRRAGRPNNRFNRGSLLAADGKLIVLSDAVLALAEISPIPTRSLPSSRFRRPGMPSPTYPAGDCSCGTKRKWRA